MMRARVASDTEPPPFRTLLVVWKLTPERAATSFTDTCLACLRTVTIRVLCAGQSERSPWRLAVGPGTFLSETPPPARGVVEPRRRVGVRRRRPSDVRSPHQRPVLPRVEAFRHRREGRRRGLVQAEV